MDLLFEKPGTAQQLTPINWQRIRDEYFKVWADFPLITRPFGVTLSVYQLNALGHMLVSMDLIDSAIDRETQQLARQKLCNSVLTWMRRNADGYPLKDKIDMVRLEPLREIITRGKIVTPFLAAASRVFRASEGKRNSSTISDLILNLIDEGQSAAEMTIDILGRNTNPGLNRFLQRVMRIGTIVDTLLDADDDFENGILKLVPNQVFRWRLKTAIARQLPRLVAGYPDRRLLWRYCLSYTHDELSPLSTTSNGSTDS